MIQDPGQIPHTAAAIRNEDLTPLSPQNGGPPYGGGGSKSENSSGDHFLSKNDDFTRGWTSDSTTWGMLRERTQKEWGLGGVQDGRACSNNLSSRRFYVLLETRQRPRPHTLSFGGGLSLRNEAVFFFFNEVQPDGVEWQACRQPVAAAVGQPLRHGRPLFLTFMVSPNRYRREGPRALSPCAAFRPFCARRTPRPPHALTRRCRGMWYLCGVHAQTLGAWTLFAGEGHGGPHTCLR